MQASGERHWASWMFRRKGPKPKVRRAIPFLQNLFTLRSPRALVPPLAIHIAGAILCWLLWDKGDGVAVTGVLVSGLIFARESQQPGRPSYVDVPANWRPVIDYICQSSAFRFDRRADRWTPLSDDWKLGPLRIEPRDGKLRLSGTKMMLDDLVFLSRRFSVDGVPDVEMMREHDRRVMQKKSQRGARPTR